MAYGTVAVQSIDLRAIADISQQQRFVVRVQLCFAAIHATPPEGYFT